MQSRELSDRLVSFVEHVRSSRSENGRKLSVLDLRLECRTQRLREYSDWPMAVLDLIEQEAACFGDQTELADLVSGTAVKSAVLDPHSWLHSPSPLAWT